MNPDNRIWSKLCLNSKLIFAIPLMCDLQQDLSPTSDLFFSPAKGR